MIDPKILRTDPDAVRRSQAARGESVELVDQLVASDQARRALIASSEAARAEQKALSGRIPRASGDEKAELLVRTRELSASVKRATAEADERYRMCACARTKIPVVRSILERHRGEPALVIGAYLDQLDELGVALDAPVIQGSTRNKERESLFDQFRRGEIPATDDDVHADRYLMAEEALSGAGYAWYEVSNWARSDAGRCLHNELYWRGADWWGAGPGAHSHVGGVRWWNVKHPGAYAAALAAGRSPGAGRELLSDEDRRVERILLELRLRDGVPLSLLREAGRVASRRALADGLLRTGPYEEGRAALTLRGRLLADAVVRDLVD